MKSEENRQPFFTTFEFEHDGSQKMANLMGISHCELISLGSLRRISDFCNLRVFEDDRALRSLRTRTSGDTRTAAEGLLFQISSNVQAISVQGCQNFLGATYQNGKNISNDRRTCQKGHKIHQVNVCYSKNIIIQNITYYPKYYPNYPKILLQKVIHFPLQGPPKHTRIGNLARICQPCIGSALGKNIDSKKWSAVCRPRLCAGVHGGQSK
jgi:hypothetical protein